MSLYEDPYTGSWSKLHFSGKLLDLFGCVFSDLEGGNASRSPDFSGDRLKVSMACELLLCSLAKPPNIEALAREIGLSQRRLSDAFRTTTGMTILEWVLEQKLMLACRLLKDGSMTVKEVAFWIGYAHRTSFVEAFSKRYGVPPSQYRDAIV